METIERGVAKSFNTDDLPWRPSTFASGVFVKDVAVTAGLEMQMVRFEPGAHFPTHTHEFPEFLLILEGELIQGGRPLGPGWATGSRRRGDAGGVASETRRVLLLVHPACIS